MGGGGGGGSCNMHVVTFQQSVDYLTAGWARREVEGRGGGGGRMEEN